MKLTSLVGLGQISFSSFRSACTLDLLFVSTLYTLVGTFLLYIVLTSHWNSGMSPFLIFSKARPNRSVKLSTRRNSAMAFTKNPTANHSVPCITILSRMIRLVEFSALSRFKKPGFDLNCGKFFKQRSQNLPFILLDVN